MIKKIFKKQIAVQLLKNGHILLYTEPNYKKTHFSVFVFENTPELLKDLTQITHK